MKHFLAIYTGTPAGLDRWKAMDAAQRQAKEKEGMAAWMRWGADHQDAIVDQGNPLGRTKRISPDGIADVRNNMAGYTIVRAGSHEDAARLFAGHPHFTIFPGDAVEIMECLPLPEM